MSRTTRAFNAVAPGEIYPKTIEAGTEVEGRLAEIAAQLGALEVEAKPKAAPKTKAIKAAPENKAQ